MQLILVSRRATGTMLVALLASLAIAACGAASPSHRASASSASKAPLKFATCMRAHGVPDFPDPGSAGGTHIAESRRVQEAAAARCEKFQESMFLPRPSAAQLARARIGALAMSKCMRAHGISGYPDLRVFPGPDGHGVATSAPTGIDPSAPAFKAANITCSRVLNKYMPKTQS